jgi:Uma2 family endonuclease
MVAVPLKKPSDPSSVASPSVAVIPLVTQTESALADFLENPPEHREWIDGQLTETSGMTILHVRVQGRLVSAWNNYAVGSGLGGEAVPEAPCRTLRQGRRPDVAYMTPELLAEYGRAPSLPMSFPLIAEVASSDDSGEGLLAKAEEYLASGALEVWVVFPEGRLILVKLLDGDWQVFGPGQTIATQRVLVGFAIGVEGLLT